jgi:hypothetical protein
MAKGVHIYAKTREGGDGELESKELVFEEEVPLLKLYAAKYKMIILNRGNKKSPYHDYRPLPFNLKLLMSIGLHAAASFMVSVAAVPYCICINRAVVIVITIIYQ